MSEPAKAPQFTREDAIYKLFSAGDKTIFTAVTSVDSLNGEEKMAIPSRAV